MILSKCLSHGYIITAGKTKEILSFANDLCKKKTRKNLFSEKITSFCGEYFISTIDDVFCSDDYISAFFSLNENHSKNNEYIDRAFEASCRYKYRLFCKNRLSDTLWMLKQETNHREDIDLKNHRIFVLLRYGAEYKAYPRCAKMQQYRHF